MYVDEKLLFPKKHYSTREESQGCLYGYSGTETQFHCKSFLNTFSLTSAGNENKLRKNPLYHGMSQKFYEPINVLIYSNVEL